MLRAFFSDEAAYTRWIQSIPGILRILDGDRDELAEDVDGPFFYSTSHLLLRVDGKYCALIRVDTRAQATFSWYVAQTRETGDTVFADFLWDRRKPVPEIVGGTTITQARAALAAFLQRGRKTVRFSRQPDQHSQDF